MPKGEDNVELQTVSTVLEKEREAASLDDISRDIAGGNPPQIPVVDVPEEEGLDNSDDREGEEDALK